MSPGFQISFLSRLPDNVAPTSLTYGPDVRLYVATIHRSLEETFAGTIYVLDDSVTFRPDVTGFLIPVGPAFRPSTTDLYVSSRAGRFEGKVSVVLTNGNNKIW